MFRRIEVFLDRETIKVSIDPETMGMSFETVHLIGWYGAGIECSSIDEIWDLWVGMDALHSPDKQGNCYFTEEGWSKIGVKTAKIFEAHGVQLRVIARAEKAKGNRVLLKDDLQVVLQIV